MLEIYIRLSDVAFLCFSQRMLVFIEEVVFGVVLLPILFVIF